MLLFIRIFCTVFMLHPLYSPLQGDYFVRRRDGDGPLVSWNSARANPSATSSDVAEKFDPVADIKNNNNIIRNDIIIILATNRNSQSSCCWSHLLM